MLLRESRPLIEQEPLYHSFSRTLQAIGGFESPPTLAVAVSGGADSLALAFLAEQWVHERQGKIIVFHVDHGLRPSSTEESQTLKVWLDRQNIPCYVLNWKHSEVTTSIQHQARDARYNLLFQKCEELKVLHLLVAHHQEDQLETFLLRLSRGSGLKGLASMPPVIEKNNLRLLRPLLHHSKQDLISFLQKLSHPYFEDPSNQNEFFGRVQMRQALSFMKLKGINSSGMLTSIHKIKQAHDTLEGQVLRILAQDSHISPFGYASISHKAFENLSFDLTCRILEKLINCIGGNIYGPRHESLESLCEKFLETYLYQGRTCGGCYLKSSKHRLFIMREPAAVEDAHAICTQENFKWDSRFFVDKVQEKALYFKLRVQMLGRVGREQLKQMPFLLPNIPIIVQQTLPALWEGENVVSAPGLGIVVEKKFHDLVRIRFSPRHPVGRSLLCSSYN
jgi:tRNA(Ile)-lysidine synthase